ncbi:MAG: hypothetical protein WCP98_15155 [Actinomycetes bacterium]
MLDAAEDELTALGELDAVEPDPPQAARASVATRTGTASVVPHANRVSCRFIARTPHSVPAARSRRPTG